MKNNWFKRTISGLLAVLLIAVCIPVSALDMETDGGKTAQTGMSPLAEFFDESQINPDYLEWLKNGGQGHAPSAQNFSYLAKSYARLRMMRNAATLPEKYDLRDFGRVNAVPDQGSLGICWAVAANSAAASSIMEQFPQTVLSPIHTAWFSYRGDEEEEYRTTDDPYLSGGNDGMSVAAMAAWKGPVMDAKIPLDAYNQQDPSEELRFESDYHLQDAFYMTNGVYWDYDWNRHVSNEITKQILTETGAVTISYYASGIQNAFNDNTFAWYNSDINPADHEVLIVGWDDNYSKENFLEGNQPENDGAWLIRNSWGTGWGDDGYFWMSYEDKTIEVGTAYLLEEKDNYAKNYQHDMMGWSFSITDSMDPDEAKDAKIANIFTAESTEQLEAVSFYTTDAMTQYTISVYTDVEEDQPESGTKQLDGQNGMEPYAGYHTIELNKPIKLNQGERFSIVVTLENPTFDAPIAIEWCEIPTADAVPEHMGSGGESYVFIGEAWEDAAGTLDDNFYITNVCIKGFTNPLPESGKAVSTVRFSQMEGPVADGTKIELTAEGGEDIYYSIGDAVYQEYDGALVLDFSEQTQQTISAYAVSDGKNGNVVTKTFTKASAQLIDLAIKCTVGEGTVIYHIETDTPELEDFAVPEYIDTIKVMAQSGDEITIDGQNLNSTEWSNDISLVSGEMKDITIEVTGEGKDTTTYTLPIYRSILKIDYKRETVSFDSTYTVKDEDGNEIHSGDSITHLISAESDHMVRITKDDIDCGVNYIPARQVATISPIDFENECTEMAYGEWNEVATKSDMSDAVKWNGEKIPLTPGQNVYIRKYATNIAFASEVVTLEVPARPEAPEVMAAEITETSVILQTIEGAVYSNGDDWQESPEFTGLTPGKEYTFQAYLLATKTDFSSEIGAAKISTIIPDINPSDYSFKVTYIDGEGNLVPGGGTVCFDKKGRYSREDIPLPYGYMEIIPAHPDEDWLYPTALEFIDGEWTVTNPIVEIMVEPMAAVCIIFKDANSNILEGLGYIKFYDSEGGGIETVIAPDGYEFIGANTYAVDVTRGADGKLIADPDEVIFVVKAIATEEPSKPSEPGEPIEPTHPSKDTDNPKTGDTSNMVLSFSLLIAAGVGIVSLVAYRKKEIVK